MEIEFGSQAGNQSSSQLSVLAVAADLIANAPDRSNQGPVVSGIHLAAKIIDVHVDDVRHRIKIEFPDLLNNGGAGNGLALVAHQEFKQSKFLWAEILTNRVEIEQENEGHEASHGLRKNI